MTEDEQAIRDVITTWLRASADGDTSTAMALMSPEVVFLVPGHKPFGRDAFADAQGGQAAYRMEATSQVREIRVSGDMAYSWTHLEIAMTPKAGGATARRSGHTLSIFRRGDDGRWVLARDANLLTPDSA